MNRDSDGVFALYLHMDEAKIAALAIFCGFYRNDMLILLRAHFQLYILAIIITLAFQFVGIIIIAG